MTSLIKTQGVVLKKKSLLNKDYLVTIFTKEQGKVKIFAKGAKKITSRRLSHLETGNLVEVLISKKNDRLYLQETKLISVFSKIKNNKEKLEKLYLFLFIVDRLLPEGQKDYSVFQIILKFLIDLSGNDKFEIDLFVKKLLVDLGYVDNKDKNIVIYSFIEEIISEKLPSFII